MSWLNKFGHALVSIGKEVQVIGPVVVPFIPVPGIAAGIAIATKISSSIQDAAQQVNTPGGDKMALAVKSTQDAFSVAKSIAAAEGKVLTVDDASIQALVQEQYDIAKAVVTLEQRQVEFVKKCQAFASSIKMVPATAEVVAQTVA